MYPPCCVRQFERMDCFISSLMSLSGSPEFYLTGGTALHRGYFGAGLRYSKDLDFFVNGCKPDAFKALKEIFKQAAFMAKEKDTRIIDIKEPISTDTFMRLYLIESDDDMLQIDFVSDVPYRFGDVVKTPFYERTDNMLNILSNKLTCLDRYEIKDWFDILAITEYHNEKNLTINWETIFESASSKAAGIYPLELASRAMGSINNIIDVQFDRLYINEDRLPNFTKDIFKTKLNAVFENILSFPDISKNTPQR